MNMAKNWGMIGGLVLHILVGGLLILTGLQKILRTAPPEALVRYGLTEQAGLIGVGALLTALLLLIPRTLSLGVLLASAFWGGAICIHLAHSEPYRLQAVLLVLTWAGGYLRNSAPAGSFLHAPEKDAEGGGETERARTGPTVEYRPDLRFFEHGAGI
jgi:hypothetical protein